MSGSVVTDVSEFVTDTAEDVKQERYRITLMLREETKLKNTDDPEVTIKEENNVLKVIVGDKRYYRKKLKGKAHLEKTPHKEEYKIVISLKKEIPALWGTM